MSIIPSFGRLLRNSIQLRNSGRGVVAHTCNPSIWEAETQGSGFAASLSYLVRPSATS